MEVLSFPTWLTWLLTGLSPFLVTWAVWITRQTHKNDKDIAINTVNDQKVRDDLERIYNIMDETKEDNKSRFDRMENKLDLFLNQELTFLKQVVKS